MPSITELMQETRVPVVAADEQGLITHINGAFEAAFGWSAKDLIGRSLSAIIPANLHDAHNLGFSRFLATHTPTLLNQPLKLTAIHKDGRAIEAEHVIIAEQRDGRWAFAATIRPLTAA